MNHIEEKLKIFKKNGHRVPSKAMILTETQIAGIRESGLVNTALLDYISNKLYVGMPTIEIDQLIYEETVKLGGIPATLNYNGYPKSLCTSVNDQVCHGIPSSKVILKEGDIINIDMSTIYKGYFSDSARVFEIGTVKPAHKKLVEVSRQCIDVGLSVVKPWTSMKSIGKSISEFASEHGYNIARDIGGHGIGLKFHEEPFVSFDKNGTNMLAVPGMVFTIEPAVNMGTGTVFQDMDNGWTIYTDDGKPSAQWEVTVAVTEEGYEVLSY